MLNRKKERCDKHVALHGHIIAERTESAEKRRFFMSDEQTGT